MIRATTISFVLSERSIGASDWRVILRHIAPISMGSFLIIMSSMFGTTILTGQTAQLLRTAPWMLVFRGLALSITVLGVAVAGDALRDILDPGAAWQIGQRRRTSLWPCGGAYPCALCLALKQTGNT